MIVLGVTGIILPHRLLSIAEFSVMPAGLYITAAVRLVIGIILLGAASRSRFPKVLYVFGALAIVGGFATLFLSAEQARAIADWAFSRGAIVARLFGLFALAMLSTPVGAPGMHLSPVKLCSQCSVARHWLRQGSTSQSPPRSR